MAKSKCCNSEITYINDHGMCNGCRSIWQIYKRSQKSNCCNNEIINIHGLKICKQCRNKIQKRGLR